MRAVVVVTVAFTYLSLLLPAMTQAPPPYIQPGLVFVYQLTDLQKQQPENAFHRYIIESVTPQGIRISIVSDIMKPASLTVNPNGEFAPGQRIDLWIPQGLSPGARLKFGGLDVVVAQTGVDLGQGLKVTVVSTADSSLMWFFIEDGPQPYNQLRGLLLGILLQQTKAVVLVNIERGGSVTTTSTYTTTRATVVDGSTITTVVTTYTTATLVSTVTVSTVSTYTTTTQTITGQPEPPQSPLPLTAAIPIAAVIAGGGLFYIRSRRRPPPPTYPYPSYPTPVPGYQHPPPGPAAMTCPACRFPVYPSEFVCRRCGFRVR